MQTSGTITKDVPRDLVIKWDKEFGKQWKSQKDSKKKLALSLKNVLELSEMEGAVLWDTMRSGSDYWRPGKLLLDAVEMLPEKYQDKISFSREDFFCPPTDLLQTFKNDTSKGFGEYAEKYSQFLNTGNVMSIAMASVLFDLAINKLPIFYCVDPYIPDYANRKEFASNIPYNKRKWLTDLPLEGCHRIILVEEIVKSFFKQGIDDVKVFELDQTLEKSYCREYVSKFI